MTTTYIGPHGRALLDSTGKPNYHSQGYSARTHGAEPWDCPHPEDTHAAKEWHRGWEDCDWMDFTDDEED
jgi:hypothetical protein